MLFSKVGAPSYEADRLWMAPNLYNGTFSPIVRLPGVTTIRVEQVWKTVEGYGDHQKLPTSGILTHYIITLTHVRVNEDAYELFQTIESDEYGTDPSDWSMREIGVGNIGQGIGMAVRLPAGIAINGHKGGKIHFFPYMTPAGNISFEYNGTNYETPQLIFHAVGDPVLKDKNGGDLIARELTYKTFPTVTTFPLPAA